MGEDVSVWPSAVIRGDVERIVIGARSNVQDGAVIHADPGTPTVVGEDCVIGHRAVVHGSLLEDGVLVGMGAILLNKVRVGRGSIIAAGAVVTVATPPSTRATTSTAAPRAAAGAVAETTAKSPSYSKITERPDGFAPPAFFILAFSNARSGGL